MLNGIPDHNFLNMQDTFVNSPSIVPNKQKKRNERKRIKEIKLQ
jgi:hypothetical protein